MDEARKSNFHLMIRQAQVDEREEIEARTASGELATDVCIAVWVDGQIVGWGDDYGTFRVLPAPTSGGELERAGEALLEFAEIFYLAATK